MRPTLFLLILCSVLLSSGSQILLKFGMTRPAIKIALSEAHEPLRLLTTIGTSPAISHWHVLLRAKRSCLAICS